MSMRSSTIRFGSRWSAIPFVLALGLAAGACSDGSRNLTGPSAMGPTAVRPAGAPVQLPTPTVQDDVSTCGSVTLTWSNVAVSDQTASEWHVQIEPGTVWDDDDKIFNEPQYNAGASLTLELEPGSYMIRVKANGTSGASTASPWSSFLTFTVAACTSGCTYTQGFWQNHGPDNPGNQDNEWPAAVLSAGMTLGSVRTYTAAELLEILNAPVKGNGLISLAHQLIAAKLNIANGASAPTEVTDAITAADAMIGPLEVPPVGTGYLAPDDVSTLVGTLTDYNEGVIGPGHCG